jgi:hypothetical protein
MINVITKMEIRNSDYTKLTRHLKTSCCSLKATVPTGSSSNVGTTGNTRQKSHVSEQSVAASKGVDFTITAESEGIIT